VRRCARCRREKAETEYHAYHKGPGGLQRVCKPCNRDETQIRALRRLLKEQGRDGLYARLGEHAHQMALVNEVLEWDRRRRSVPCLIQRGYTTTVRL
jgi:hypothetical protein